MWLLYHISSSIIFWAETLDDVLQHTSFTVHRYTISEGKHEDKTCLLPQIDTTVHWLYIDAI